MLHNKHIALGVTGSIAAFKAASLLRLLARGGAQLHPILTASARHFVGEASFAAFAGRPCIGSLWAGAKAGDISHVALAGHCDAVVVAPASAHMLAMAAQGLAGDPLSALLLASSAPKIFAPAMETGMWNNPATQHNVALLRARGCTLVAPEAGALASGGRGMGRMASPETIAEHVYAALSRAEADNPWLGQQVLVTAGPTREPMDPARFISNASTGKMGLALAQAVLRRGAAVHLVCGPTTLGMPAGLGAGQITRITTCAELLAACRAQLAQSTMLLMAAAPADFAPASTAAHKQKKDQHNAGAPLALLRTPDVLQSLQARTPQRLVMGFAAETDDLLAHGRAKLQRKNLDLLLANPIGRPACGFAAATNCGTLLRRDGSSVRLPLMRKEAMAAAIVADIEQTLRQRGCPSTAPPP